MSEKEILEALVQELVREFDATPTVDNPSLGPGLKDIGA